MNFLYLFGILLENIYRSIKSFVPAMVLAIIFILGKQTNAINIIVLIIIMLGGLWYEFKITDLFK